MKGGRHWTYNLPTPPLFQLVLKHAPVLGYARDIFSRGARAGGVPRGGGGTPLCTGGWLVGAWGALYDRVV